VFEQKFYIVRELGYGLHTRVYPNMDLDNSLREALIKNEEFFGELYSNKAKLTGQELFGVLLNSAGKIHEWMVFLEELEREGQGLYEEESAFRHRGRVAFFGVDVSALEEIKPVFVKVNTMDSAVLIPLRRIGTEPFPESVASAAVLYEYGYEYADRKRGSRKMVLASHAKKYAEGGAFLGEAEYVIESKVTQDLSRVRLTRVLVDARVEILGQPTLTFYRLDPSAYETFSVDFGWLLLFADML